jgi:broad specificity phosphatase PhoE
VEVPAGDGPGGESFPVLYARAQRAWAFFRDRHGGTEDVPLVVTHGTFADFLLQAALGLTPSRHLFRFRNTGVAVLATDAGGPALVELLPLQGIGDVAAPKAEA